MSSPAVIAQIEHPASRTTIESSIVTCRGWAFGRETGTLTKVRVRCGGICAAGSFDRPRPDVREVYPEAEINSGWAVTAYLPAGKHVLIFEYGNDAGCWFKGAEQEVTVAPGWAPRWAPWISPDELLQTQFPTHAVHAPRQLVVENWPKLRITTNRPKLSIVTPSFQQAWALEMCMESVASDAGVWIDYIIHDGGSTDGSVELIRKRARQLKSWESRPDAGQADAISRGFDKTAGAPEDLMAWLNSDDFYIAGALRFVAEYFARHPDVDVVYGHRVLVDQAGHEIARWYLPKHDPDVLRLYDFIPQETMFWRRRIWDKVGGLDTTFQFAMDWDLLLRFQGAGAKIVRLPYFLACFRVHPQQKTSALISTQGQAEIDALRRRTFGRDITPDDILKSKQLRRYLRKSAWIEQLWKWGIRAR